MILRRMSLALPLLLAQPSVCFSQSQIDMTSHPWTSSFVSSIVNSPNYSSTVKSFIIDKTPEIDNTSAICSFAFSDLSGSGQYQLVASIDISGRGFCNKVLIAYWSESTLNVQTVDAWQVSEVSSLFEKVGSSNSLAIVVPSNISEYNSGTSCVSIWKTVYEVNGSRIVDKSSAYSDFYRKEKDTISRSLDASNPNYSCQLMQLFKLDRFLRVDVNAGATTAKIWMSSPDPNLRAKAAEIFADIGGVVGVSNLTAMAKDNDSSVAAIAQHGVQSLSRPKTQ